MGLMDWLFPKERDFYKMLADQSEVSLKGIQIFSDYMCMPTSVPGQMIADIEHEGDRVRRFLIDDLNKTFITPIEREDIFGLSRTVDDILDRSKSAVEEFEIYKLNTNEFLKTIVFKLKNGVEHLHEAIVLLKEHPAISIEKCSASKDDVDEIEILYYEALAKLTESDDVKYMFKMREIYKHILQISLCIDKAANIVLDIIVKTT